MYNLVNSRGWKRRVLVLFSLEKRRSRRYLAAVIHYLTVLQKKETDSSHRSTGKRQEAMATGCNRENSG